MGTLHHNPQPHRSLNGIHYEEPRHFQIKSVGHLPQLARPEGNDHERRASVTSIQKVRLMEARRVAAKPKFVKRPLTPFEEGLIAKDWLNNPYSQGTDECREWDDGYNARADGQF